MNKMRKDLFFDDFIKIDNQIWFASSVYNALFSYDLKSGEVVYKGCFRDEITGANRLFLTVIKFQNDLFFIPFNGEKIYRYDIKMEIFTSIELPAEICTKCKFYSVIQIENECYLLPTAARKICRLNLKTYQIDIIDNPEVSSYLNRGIASFGNYFENNQVYVTYFLESNLVFIFDKIKKKIKTMQIGEENIISVVGSGEGVYFLCERTGKLIYLSLKNYTWRDIDIYYHNISREGQKNILEPRSGGYVHSSYRDGEIYVFPDLGTYGIQINLETRETKEIIYTLHDQMNFNSKIKVLGNDIYFFSSAESSFVIINKKNQIKKIKLEINPLDYDRMLELANADTFWMEEERICTLDHFFCKVEQQKEQQMEREHYGSQIYARIRGEIE